GNGQEAGRERVAVRIGALPVVVDHQGQRSGRGRECEASHDQQRGAKQTRDDLPCRDMETSIGTHARSPLPWMREWTRVSQGNAPVSQWLVGINCLTFTSSAA